MRPTPSILFLAVLLSAGPVLSQPVVFDVGTNYSGDTLYLGHPAEIRFYVDAGPHEVAQVCLTFAFRTTNGISVGALQEGVNTFFSAYAMSTFAAKGVASPAFPAQNPDTVIIFGVSFGGPWEGSDLFARVVFEPQDTGTIFVDSIFLPPANSVFALDDLGSNLPLDWRPGPVVVAPCTYQVGDLNGSATLTLADIILLVNYIFKMGTPPQPHVKIGDVDCNGMITSADIIYLVNHQGKGGPPPPCPCYNP